MLVGRPVVCVCLGMRVGFKAALGATIAIGSSALLAGCALSTQSLESESSAASQNFPDNYEVIYQRLSTTGERCYPRGNDGGNAGNRLAGSIESQGEIHRESGFADFRLVTSSLGVKTNYFLLARIEKVGSGSRVTTKVSNPITGPGLSKIIFRWANGDPTC